jgi:hypothetical protein
LVVFAACAVGLTHMSQRPYVRAKPADMLYVADGVSVRLEFEDIGKTPALQARFSINWKLDTYPMSAPISYREPDSVAAELMPDSPVGVGIQMLVGAGNLPAIKAEKGLVYLWGKVTYCDYAFACFWPISETDRYCYAFGGDLRGAGDCSGALAQPPQQIPQPQPGPAPILPAP